MTLEGVDIVEPIDLQLNSAARVEFASLVLDGYRAEPSGVTIERNSRPVEGHMNRITMIEQQTNEHPNLDLSAIVSSVPNAAAWQRLEESVADPLPFTQGHRALRPGDEGAAYSGIGAAAR